MFINIFFIFSENIATNKDQGGSVCNQINNALLNIKRAKKCAFLRVNQKSKMQANNGEKRSPFKKGKQKSVIMVLKMDF